jgi:hypothetical protein
MAQKSAKPPAKESIPPPLPGSGGPPPLPSERPVPPPVPPPLPKVQVDGLDMAETLPGRSRLQSDVSIEVDMGDLEPSSTAGHNSIDKLLALTGESWNVDDQVRTLKAAAATETRPSPELTTKARALLLPRGGTRRRRPPPRARPS